MFLGVWALATKAQLLPTPTNCTQDEANIYGFEMEELNGDTFSLSEYEGKVFVMFNVATYWGLYEQYIDWSALKVEFGDQGFDVLAVPSNNFGLQEPGGNENILDGIRHVRPGGGFVPNYRVAGKVDVNGANESPVYTHIKERCPNPQNMITDTVQIYWSPVKQTDITWNYEKILIDHEGKVFKRYVPAMNPKNIIIRNDIEYLLSRKIESDSAAASNVSNKTVKKHNLSEVIKKAHHP